MEQKPGWTYHFISSLNQHIAINDTTNVLYTEDKTRYSPEEANLLRQLDFQIPIQIHILKKVFSGTIVGIN